MTTIEQNFYIKKIQVGDIKNASVFQIGAAGYISNRKTNRSAYVPSKKYGMYDFFLLPPASRLNS
ncbi:spore germination GerPB [Salsuginibacillus halophilus]|uniref:Spore germination GerPB n=1 Tax=Salsuginibacillus halophilus TaxID=517424 RepID=A0A2P8HYJ6_9BACI|nr:spore germination protein GerPB [Salsuginibacillus halophilus]PSL51296.1 spore germination GerPB [Salsuginibacillus halophilus]